MATNPLSEMDPQWHESREFHVKLDGLTGLLARLGRMTNAELQEADPGRAAKAFRINPNHAAGYIISEQRHRGFAKVLQWEEVDAPPPREIRKPISDVDMVRCVTRWGWGDSCPHGVTYPGPCSPCEEAVLRARGPTNFRRRPQRSFWND
jgi:hypothetical protein